MLKFLYVFLPLVMLAVATQGVNLSCSDIQNSQADLKSDVKSLQDLVYDLRMRLGERFLWPKPPPVENVQKKVAFFVGRNNNLGPVTQNTNIVFDSVVTNIGSAYSASTGRFTAPVTAAYQFSFTVAAQQGKKAAVQIMKNGVRIMYVWSMSTPEWAPSSEEAILSLKAGDQVWLELLPLASNVEGKMYTTFSGFLIFED